MGEEIVKREDMEILEPESSEVEVWRPGKAPISFLKCSKCYLRKECKFADLESDECALKSLENVDTSTGEGIINLVQTVLAAQAERVLRFIKIEEMEGGFPDPSVTNELMTFVALVEKFKKILTDDDFLVIRAKGKTSMGVLERLFSDIKDDE